VVSPVSGAAGAASSGKPGCGVQSHHGPSGCGRDLPGPALTGSSSQVAQLSLVQVEAVLFIEFIGLVDGVAELVCLELSVLDLVVEL
jgi:hypothetical protein